jgi:hypothetical protein
MGGVKLEIMVKPDRHWPVADSAGLAQTSSESPPKHGMEGRFRKVDRPDRRSGEERRQGESPAPDQIGVFDWLQAEQRELDQATAAEGIDRRSGRARRGSISNRRDARRSIPFSVAPHGELRSADGLHWHCTLWDVSRSGLCLIATGVFELPLDSELIVRLYEVVGLGSLFFKARLRWFAIDEFQTYLGLQFSDPVELPTDTFLERYLQASFDL